MVLFYYPRLWFGDFPVVNYWPKDLYLKTEILAGEFIICEYE